MTEYKTIDGFKYAFAGSSPSRAAAKDLADMYIKQGRIVAISYDERYVHSERVYKYVYAVYTRSQ